MGERTVDQHPEVVLRCVRKNLPLDVAVEHVVRRLVGLDRAKLGELGHLLRAVVRHARVPDLPLAYQIGEDAAGLLSGRLRVGPVHLVEIDVVGA